MDILRKGFDYFYDIVKPAIFWATRKDPETAHHLFASSLRGLERLRLGKIILDNPANELSGVAISNAAGFNKNAEIPPQILKYLGFDRVVVGTVTCDAWLGNPRPRTRRYAETGSLVNWMGLPGIGAEGVAANLEGYKYDIPLTINLMATPGKKGDKVLRDLESSVLALRNTHLVKRWEVNISCPNTLNHSGGLDARREYQKGLGGMLAVVTGTRNKNQYVYIKVSADLTEKEIDAIIETCNQHDVVGFTTTNTTTSHDVKFIPETPGKGGASGNAVYDASLRVQKQFARRIRESGKDYRIIACGGINSVERAIERVEEGASEIQIYTPLIFKGTRLLRELQRKL